MMRRARCARRLPAKEFYTPYLPDPIVRQATLSLPDGGGNIDMPRFDDLPRSARGRELARSCQLVVRPGRDRVQARVSGREVLLEVPKGRVQTVHLAAKLEADEMSVIAFAHPDWHGNDSAAFDKVRQKLADAAASGEAPLLAPSRAVTIVLCHAAAAHDARLWPSADPAEAGGFDQRRTGRRCLAVRPAEHRPN